MNPKFGNDTVDSNLEINFSAKEAHRQEFTFTTVHSS